MKNFQKFNLEILDSIPTATFFISLDSKVLYWNHACELLTGVKADEVIGTSNHWKTFYKQKRLCLADLVLKDNWEEHAELYENIKKNKLSARGLSAENWCQTPSGEKYLLIDASSVHDKDGNMIGVVESLIDATQLINTQQAVKKLITAVENSPVATYIVDIDHKFEYINPKYSDITGYSMNDVLGTYIWDYNSEENSKEKYDELLSTIRAGHGWQGVLANKRKDGSSYWANTHISCVKDENGDVIDYICIQEDISKEHEEKEELKHRAEHDGLTNLLNRKEFDIRLQLLLDDKRIKNETNILVFLDLDNFKNVNDRFGHDAGDKLLLDVARILKDSVRDTDCVARYGGDEFTLLLKRCSVKKAEEISDNILSVIKSHKIFEKNKSLGFGASIGIAVISPDIKSSSELMKKADVACYYAKAKGKNSMHVYAGEDLPQ